MLGYFNVVEGVAACRITSEKDGLEACNILHAAGPSKVVITSVHVGESLLLIGSHQKSKGQPPEQFKIVIPKMLAYFTNHGQLMGSLTSFRLDEIRLEKGIMMLLLENVTMFSLLLPLQYQHYANEVSILMQDIK
ncbi:hypothetical protein NE237_005561 [Protea cynaroides]|uniref:pyridoxal kinase n=1 Tax=Protea cynaroides TaxID=273540 RepID=A0A9Q0GLZ2_9MAGN|nr:hypothetical protein NE237_005561 [Protea cynaroides]